jgi:hypothetical protein
MIGRSATNERSTIGVHEARASTQTCLATARDKRCDPLSQFRQFRVRKGCAWLEHGRLHIAHPQKHLGHLRFDREVDILRNVACHLSDAQSIELLHYHAK